MRYHICVTNLYWSLLSQTEIIYNQTSLHNIAVDIGIILMYFRQRCVVYKLIWWLFIKGQAIPISFSEDVLYTSVKEQVHGLAIEMIPVPILVSCT